jgi:uncharacterized RDD family membrane protein YckC
MTTPPSDYPPPFPTDPNQPQGGPPPWTPPPGGPPQGGPPPAWTPAPPPTAAYGYGQPPPGGPPPGLYYDQASQLTLPAGTQLASVGRRIGAYFLAIPLAIITLGIGYLIWGLILWNKGQSPALKVLGMRVWRPESQRNASFGFMALRNIVGAIVENIVGLITGLISFIMFLVTKEHKSLHDLIGGTVVLYDPNNTLEGK